MRFKLSNATPTTARDKINPQFLGFSAELLDLNYQVPESYIIRTAVKQHTVDTLPAASVAETTTPDKALAWQTIWSARRVSIAVLGLGLAALTVILLLQDVISRRRGLHGVVRITFDAALIVAGT